MKYTQTNIYIVKKYINLRLDMVLSASDPVAVSQGCRCIQVTVLFQHREREKKRICWICCSQPQQLFLTLKASSEQHCVQPTALSVSISVYQITYVCRLMNSNRCVNVCHIVTDLKLHKSNYSCVCSEWIALSHYIDTKILISLCCWTVFLSLNKHHMIAWQFQAET